MSAKVKGYCELLLFLGCSLATWPALGEKGSNLAMNLGPGYAPAWSPDGTRILFVSEFPEGLFRMHPDGSGREMVMAPTEKSRVVTGFVYPQWSPDGRSIAATLAWEASKEVHAGGVTTHLASPNIWIVDPATQQHRQITFRRFVEPSSIQWSGDSKKLVFVSDKLGVPDVPLDEPDPNTGTGKAKPATPTAIWIVNADGSGEIQLTKEADFFDNGPTWSPDGSCVAFHSGTFYGPVNIFQIRSDGSGLKQLTQGRGNLRPYWSPDGKKIAYIHRTDPGEGEIWFLDPNGGEPQKVIGGFPYEIMWTCGLAWHPDSERILFVAEGDLFVVNLDGSGLKRLTHKARITRDFIDTTFALSPDGTQAVFERDGMIFVAHLDLAKKDQGKGP